MAKPKAAPDWATPPLTIHQAAEALGFSRASLDYALKDPAVQVGVHFELRGNRKVFYRENIMEVRKVLTKCASTSSGSMVGHTSTATAPTARGTDALSKLRTLAAQKKKERT